jgi:hypothetical protein
MFLFNGVSNGSAADAALSNLPLFTKGNIRFRNGHVIRVLTEQRQVGHWKCQEVHEHELGNQSPWLYIFTEPLPSSLKPKEQEKDHL